MAAPMLAKAIRKRACSLALALGIGISVQERAQALPAPPAQPPGPAVPAAPQAGGAPLPSAPNDSSEKDFRKIYTAWLNRDIMARYPADTDPAGADFVRAAIAAMGANPPFGMPPRLVKQERTFDLKAANDPALLLMIAAVEPPTPRRQDAFAMALAALPDSKYPKFLSFLAAMNAKRPGGGKNAKPNKAQDELSLKYLNAGLNDDSFLPDEMAALRWYFDSSLFHALFSRNQDRVIDIFKYAPSVAPWVKEYVLGVHFVDAAWDARGGDWASNVTQAGWKGFAENLASARTHLVNSWKENPHDPAAATEMITVCMGEEVQIDTMRFWFDRAVAADFDYIPAYSALRWGMRPRWGGSYEQMNAFGQECAATGRYDTMVPNERIATALDISDDAQDRGAQFKDPEIAKQVLTVIDTYLALPHPCIRVGFSHTLAAIVADKVGRTDERDWHMAAVHYKPVMDSWLKKMENLNQLASRAQADANPTPPDASPAPPDASPTPPAASPAPPAASPAPPDPGPAQPAATP